MPGSELEEVLRKELYLPENYNAVSFNPFIIKKFAYIAPRFRKKLEKAHRESYKVKVKPETSREEVILGILSNIC